MKKLFGIGGGKPAPQQPKADPLETIAKLNEQCDTVQKRIKVLENRTAELKNTAIQKKKAGDTRGALMAMKNMKMQEKELAKLDGQSIMLEQQKMMIESSNFDVGVINSIKAGKDAIENMNKQMNVDDIADLKDEMEDLQAEINERQEFFADVAQEGQDELLDELDALEADALAGELEGLDSIGTGAIKAPAKNMVPAQAEAEDEEAELAKLMMA